MSQLALGAAVQDMAPAPRSLPNEERAALDAYWTPPLHAGALVRWLDRTVLGGRVPARVLEPSVGGGAWVDAVRETLPQARVTGCDLDESAPGLTRCDVALVGDFCKLEDGLSFDLVLGNPPYGGDLAGWVDASLKKAPLVAYLLRSTFLGSCSRLPWWLAQPPSDVVIVSPRPKWGGPGARTATDTCDSVFVVWERGFHGFTRMRWLDCRDGVR